ncbi:carbohydrate ABC transporter permease [Vallitalea okinawensis]|uniref:carbohydrate ABC transporter permease n=1 Tax=Vallitalea okinawensis TaxID=2078660 RepID=UPI000CFD9F59|nr:carbohydrate ABC transporter permease [Vallitalea okinawensis]
MAGNKIKTSFSEKIFDSTNTLFMIIFCMTTLYPFVYLLSMSLASANVPLTQLYLIPPEISFESYKRVFSSNYIASGFLVTIYKTILGTLLSVLFTFTLAYPLSRKYFPNRGFWTALVVFTMFFSGGLIPNYLLVRNLGLMNSINALVLPNLVNAFYMTIVRNYMMSLPDSLEESAKIDGANDIRILVSIILPICKPIIATIALWIAVWHWNEWFQCLLYITDPSKQVLQVIMRRVVMEGTQQVMDLSGQSEVEAAAVTTEGVKAATIMVTTIPILIVYPFIQKYFVKGIMVGSLKG